jgi:hypothetical protein
VLRRHFIPSPWPSPGETVDKSKDVLREPQHERSQSPSNKGFSAHPELLESAKFDADLREPGGFEAISRWLSEAIPPAHDGSVTAPRRGARRQCQPARASSGENLREEVIQMLEKAGVTYDPKYLG